MRYTMCAFLLTGLVGGWLAGPATAQQPAVPAPSALLPASTGGLETVDLALAKLSTHRRLLIVGAHPDDEDNPLLTLVARGMGGEAAYLSLTRGEGGQNLLGPELGVGLGAIRTGELLAARQIDGGRQFFTRAFDFGYTRSLDETFGRWPRELLLEDAVRAVRRFKPQVLVAVFPPDSRAGHGQHQASGVIAGDIWEQSGEPDRFAGLTAEGLLPWSPAAFYRRTWWDPEQTTLTQDLGAIEPLTGRSIYQLAGASRSMHRSQDMGRVQEPGPREAGYGWMAGGVGKEGEALFAGIDTRLAAIAADLPPGDERDRIEADLERVEELARKARQRLSPSGLASAASPLAEILTLLGEARLRLSQLEPAVAVGIADDILAEKEAIAAAALAAAAGVMIDATTETDSVTADRPLAVTVRVWNSGTAPLAVRRLEILAPADWSAGVAATAEREVVAGEMAEWPFEVGAPGDAAPSLPYFLWRPRDGDFYDWSAAAPEVKGEPWQPPVRARFELVVAGVPVILEREVVLRYGDQAVGEVRRPVRAVPLVEVAVEPQLLLWPLDGSLEKRVEVSLVSHAAKRLAGRLEIALPAGWSTAGMPAFDLAPGARQKIGLMIRQPVAVVGERAQASVTAVVEDGGRYSRALPVVDYPHVRPVPISAPAEVEIQTVALELPRLGRIGYIRGASDRVPELLAEVGVPFEILGTEDLQVGDLSVFDAIVVGSRAYEIDPALRSANDRLLDFLRAGGLVVVQYQQYQFVRGEFAPLPLEISRPHGRVTDEASPVRLLVADHPVFTRPNRITDADWDGWVQERGLYFPATWDEGYTPLLALQDPERPEERGALLVAEIGEGRYVYTGLSFFRELPAGVPGAFRLFANLLALAPGTDDN